jgi:hypothetical protein
MNVRKVWLGLFVLGAALVLFGGCSSGGSGGNGSGSGSSSGAGGQGSGICEDTCLKACPGGDNDCDPSKGQRCCPFGPGADFCQLAKDCPKFCSDTSSCDTSMGQDCVLTSLATSQKVCEPAQQGLKLCQTDSDCAGAMDVCCGIYNKGICTPANKCPKSCTADGDCNSLQGEICCTSVGKEEPSLSATGLCLNPTTEPCPKKCDSSANCDSPTAPLCCNGLCAATCAKQCQQSSDCDHQICCKLPTSTSLGAPPHIFKAAPSCSGTPSFTTCAQCQANGCRCPGCGTEAGAGFCSTNSTYSCSTCGSSYGCTSTRCAGCSPATGGACTGTPVYTTCSSCPTSFCSSSTSTYCRGCTVSGASCTGTASCSYFSGSSTAGAACAALGCTFNAQTYACTGAPNPCSTFTTSTTCSGGCSWSTGTCSGTVTACSLLADSTSCQGQSGCTWSTGACTGTFTSCPLLTDSTSCQSQAGCYWSSTGTSSCVGTITPCSQLTMNTCNLQSGCTFM